ncbi:cation diffusion facilitator family transporter [Paenibacillus sp. NEAU-GSW1]|uniref:cation diffusion facilitator family transporter n=1 Tax=Paenibacillus sp. NEAU-GSW1 TaxID=2682486 RepID=UPI0012E18DA1|nr:cation transporter dimerization domain-containing protein [Paenibacillus sp. NEAU-GSW1]MUT67280.1 cation diffusion facilitator family transporter [Paenibacillus sp. NEAU-GSW1]
MSSKQRYAEAETAGRTDLWGNAALALFKGIVAVISGSKVLLADAVRSAGRAAAAFAALSGFSNKKGKPSEEMKALPKFGAIAVLLLPVVFIIAGVEIGIAAIKDIVEAGDHPLQAPHWSALAAIVAGIVVQQLLLPMRERQLGLLSSLAALLGSGAALIGEAISVEKLLFFEPAGAIAVALIVVLSGCKSISGSVRTGQSVEAYDENSDDIMQLIQRVEGVITVESLRAKEHGHYVAAEAVISVNPRLTVLEGNDIAKRVKHLLMLRFSHLTDVHIYVEPYDPGFPYKSNHDPNQEQVPTLLQ